jgi:hypothetical protein
MDSSFAEDWSSVVHYITNGYSIHIPEDFTRLYKIHFNIVLAFVPKSAKELAAIRFLN